MPNGHEIPGTKASNQSDSYAHKVELWNPDPNPDAIPEITDLGDQGRDESGIVANFNDETESELVALHTFLKETPAYQRLLDKIKAATSLTQVKAGVIADVRRIVGEAYKTLEKQRGSADVQTLVFEISLDLKAFLSWYWENDSCGDLRTVLTLTGSAANAQALTCEKFLKQNWPTNGAELLHLLERAFQSSSKKNIHESKKLFKVPI